MSDISSEILHSLPFGVVVLDGQGIVIAHNGTWCNFLTTNNVPETCVGTDFLNGELLTQIYADSAPLVYQNITGVMRGALPQFKMEQVCSIPAGTVQVFSMMVVPLAAAAGGCIISLYDITDSIPMEQILSVPEDVFQSFFDCSAVGMVVCSSRQVIQKVNEKLCTLLGYFREELVGVYLLKLLHPDDEQVCRERFTRLASGSLCDFAAEVRCLHRNGSTLWVSLTVSNTTTGSRTTRGHIVVLQDITIRKLAEDALKSSEERYVRLFEMNLNGVLLVECESGRILDINAAGLDMYGYAKAALLELTLFDLSADPEGTAQGLQMKDAYIPLRWHRKKDGTQFPVEVSVHSFEYKGKHAHVAAIRDISERLKSSEQLRAALEGNRALHGHLQKAIEEERIAISRDIHDDLGQHLTLLKLGLESVVYCHNKDETEEQIRVLIQEVDASIGIIRRIAGNLRPPLLDSIGLTAALEWQVHEFEKYSGISCFAMINSHIDGLDTQTATVLMRIVQESFTNIIRHSDATEVALSVCLKAGDLILEISDNGCGVSEHELARTTSYGVMGMRERARSCRGNLHISGEAGQGTIIRLTIPVGEKQ